MSDTATDEAPAPTPTPTFKWFGGDDIRAAIKVDPSLTANGVKSISPEKARAAIRNRLKAVISTGRDVTGVGRIHDETVKAELDGMAQAIVWSLTDAEMFEEVVTNLDLRPYVKFFADHPDAKFRTEQWDTGQRAETRNVILAGLQDEVRVAALGIQSDTDRTPEQRDATVKAYQDFDPKVAGRKIEQHINKRVGEIEQTPGITPEGAEQELFDPDDPYGLLDEVAGERYVYPVEHFQQLMEGGFIETLEQLSAAEADEYEASGVQGFVPFTTGETMTLPSGEQWTRKFNALDAASWIHDLPEDQVIKIQHSLEAAGYFDSNDGQLAYDEGYSQDKVTRDAWKKALFDAATSRKPMPEFLAERAKARGDRRREQRQALQTEAKATWQSTDSFRGLREQADAYALEVLGRRLRTEEYKGVRDYIVGLQKDRISTLGDEEGDESWQNDESLARGFNTAELQRGVNRGTASEQASQAGFDFMQKINDKFGVEIEYNSTEDDG